MDVEPDVHSYLSNPIAKIKGVTLRYLITGLPPRALVVIEIEEFTTRDQISEIWKDITTYREKASTFQGSDLSINYDVVLHELSKKRHNEGWGYGEIAKFLNYHSITELCFLHYQLEHEEVEHKWQSMGWFGMYTIFVAMRMSKEKFDHWYELGITKLDEGVAPWNTEYGPFDKYVVRENIRYFDARVAEGRITIGPHYEKGSSLEIEQAYLLSKGWYQKVNVLLRRSFKTHWDENKELILRWLDNISQMVSSSDSPIIRRLSEDST